MRDSRTGAGAASVLSGSPVRGEAMERRNFIRASLATAGGLAFAGCSDDAPPVGEGGNGSESGFPSHGVPTYSEWPPDSHRTNDFVLFTHINIAHLHAADDSEETPAGEDDENMLVGLPLYGFLVTALWYHFGFWSYPWNGDLGAETEPDGMDTSAATMSEAVFLFHGDYDPEVFASEYADGFEQREADEFTVFEGQPGSGTERAAYAVADHTVAVLIAPEDIEAHDEAVGLLDDALDNYAAGSDRVVDDADGEWLYDATGEADFAIGFWRVDGLENRHFQLGEDDESESETDIESNPVFENVESFISMAALPESEDGVDGDTSAARYAALYPDGETPSEDDLREGLLGDGGGDELEVITDDDRVYAASEVSEDELDTSE